MHNYRFLALLGLLLISVALTGCWDMKELQDRSFVTALAIDLAEQGMKEGQTQADSKLESFEQRVEQRDYRLSLQVIKLAPSRGDSGPKESANTFVVSNTGQSMLETLRDMLGQSSKGFYFEHLDAIILSEAAVRLHGLSPVLDLFTRDPEMRRRIKVFITQGEARKLLEFKPPSGETGGRFFAGIIGNHKKNMHVGGARTDLGFISQALDNEMDPNIPNLELANGIVKSGGLAVFRKDQFIGYLDEYTLQGLKLISGTAKSAAITSPCPDHPWSSLVFELFIHETVLRPHVNGDGSIYFTLDISMWGTAAEIMCGRYHDVSSTPFLRQMEQLVAQEVKLNTLHTIQVLQEKKVDAARLKGKLKAYLPQEWKKVKQRWEEIYPTVSLQTSVNVVIRGVGEHR